MTFLEYQKLFETILTTENPPSPYNNPAYINFTKLNQSRMSRWDKTMVLNEELVKRLGSIQEPQHWIIITEPWCGDAAHSLPFMIALAESSDKITYDIELRDSEPHRINHYLTNGGKSIPKLIALDPGGQDLFSWGPRPVQAQKINDDMRATNARYDEINLKLQVWYNADKGVSFQEELLELITQLTDSPVLL
ncbi:MAG TPA: thioredoxin family protein [Bacteroidetes bacterium]|nr:thioredoxin family protein [Bacteroidota bacterium]